MRVPLKRHFSILCIPVLGLSCTNTIEQTNSESASVVNQRQAYYDRIPDAPLDLYCHIDNLLDSDVRKEICLSVMFNENKNLSVDMGIVIKDSQLDTVEIQTLYFDKEGIPQKDAANFERLNKLINSIDIKQIPTMKNLEDADFALRLQVERFCIGYVQVIEPGIMSMIDSVRKKSND